MAHSLLSSTIIVGIGASAGGLEALGELIKNLQVSEKTAFIVAQHLSPTYKSMMVELLSKNSPLEVVEALDGQKIEPKKIYIAPPNKNIFVVGDNIALKTPQEDFVGPKPSIDLFFASLATSKRHDAVGIILSGTGTDGTRGCAQIKAEGGITIAQDPKSAKYDGMPASAIHSGAVDIVLTADQIGAELEEIEKYISGEISLQSIAVRSKDDLGRIFDRLRDVKRVDFSDYKLTTLNRRLRRRMAALKISKIDEYVEFLLRDENEPVALYKDFLIGVTSFFRDKEAFYDLKAQLEALVSQKDQNENIRVWDVGCYTGEEAYSVAIVVAEILAERGERRDVQIFATDIDDEATAAARQGVYTPGALSELPSDLLKKYFVPKGESYQVSKVIRDMIIFSRHDVIKDPPFTRLDLIVCRNLLIYFNASLQERVMPMFHYALVSGGLLFLGKSESIGTYQNLFTSVTKSTKIYKREFSPSKEPPKNINAYRPSANAKEQRPLSSSSSAPTKKTLSEALLESLGEHFLPLSLIVNEGMDIVFIKEKNPYLHYPQGVITTNIFKSVHEELALELRTLLHECNKNGEAKVGIFHKLEVYRGIERLVRMVVLPLLHHSENSKLFVVSFQEEDPDSFDFSFSQVGNGEYNEEAKKLEAELVRTKMHLQTVIEELETSNEELQSLNEEMQSANEELQSTNEELETTNEELQSTNEELQTAYAELKAVSDEREKQRKKVEVLNSDLRKRQQQLQGILDSSHGAIVAFEHVPDSVQSVNDYRCVLANPRCFDYLGIENEDMVGKTLSKLSGGAFNKSFFEKAEEVSQNKSSSEFEYRVNVGGTNRWYKVGLMSFGDGFVAVFDDITSIQEALLDAVYKEEQIRRERAFSDELIESSNAMLVVLNDKIEIERFNKSAEELTGYRKDEVIGKNWMDIFVSDENKPEMGRLFVKLLSENYEEYNSFDSHITIRDGIVRLISWRYSRVVSSNGKKVLLGFGIDITDRHLYEQQTKLQKEYLDTLVNSQNTIIVVTDGYEMIDANRAFFEFFSGYESVVEFKKEHKCICDFFEKVEDDGFVYEGKGGLNWLDQAIGGVDKRVLIKKDGEEHYFALRVSEFTGDEKHKKIASFVDVSQIESYRQYLEQRVTEEVARAKMQEQIMLQQSKMAAMGEMLGAIAHQWRQPLNALALNVQDVRQALSYGELNEDYLKNSERKSMDLIRYMSRTIDDFRDFFKPEANPTDFLVTECIEEAIAIFDAQLKNYSISVERVFGDTPPLHLCKNQLKQVFLNIISNAKDAILEAADSSKERQGIIKITVNSDRSLVNVRFWDNGCKVEESILSRVFEPYFTTKPQGKGTGIGLYMSKIIVEQHMRGNIYIQNSDDGVEVTVTLTIG